MKHVVILTGHFPQQKRRSSMLWISEHLQRMGWHVTHVTVGYSWLSRLKKDRRLQALEHPPIQGNHKLSETLSAIFHFSPIHPLNTGSKEMNRLVGHLQSGFRMYWARKLALPLKHADLVICESGAPVALAPILSRYAPNAPRIYRVNDDIALLNAPEYLLKNETDFTPHFTRISSANPKLVQRFDHPNITIDPMGIPTDLVKAYPVSPSPRSPKHITAVCAGTTQLDYKALKNIAKRRPHWHIHVLGRIDKKQAHIANNITYHGEVSFIETLKHIAAADVGLAPYIDRAGVEYQTSNSNRLLLYRHFGLPILGPDRLCDSNLPRLIGYNAPDALERCETMGRQPEIIPDWAELAKAMAQNAPITPPTEVA